MMKKLPMILAVCASFAAPAALAESHFHLTQLQWDTIEGGELLSEAVDASKAGADDIACSYLRRASELLSKSLPADIDIHQLVISRVPAEQQAGGALMLVRDHGRILPGYCGDPVTGDLKRLVPKGSKKGLESEVVYLRGLLESMSQSLIEAHRWSGSDTEVSDNQAKGPESSGSTGPDRAPADKQKPKAAQ